MNSMVSVSAANTGAPGISSSPERWMAVRVTASNLNVFLQMWKRMPKELLTGDEFEAGKHMVTHIQASAGVFIDAIHSANTIDQLIDINNEFYKMAAAKTGI
ncbi:hypothetical protein D3C85_15750 [compost metagenome]